MTTFDKREDAFEKKFAHDAELRFKAEARRNRLLGTWAADLLGISQARIERSVQRLADRADVVVAVSPHLVETLAQRGVDATLIPNGCDVDLFSATPMPSAEATCASPASRAAATSRAIAGAVSSAPGT